MVSYFGWRWSQTIQQHYTFVTLRNLQNSVFNNLKGILAEEQFKFQSIPNGFL